MVPYIALGSGFFLSGGTRTLPLVMVGVLVCILGVWFVFRNDSRCKIGTGVGWGQRLVSGCNTSGGTLLMRAGPVGGLLMGTSPGGELMRTWPMLVAVLGGLLGIWFG